MTKLTRDDVLKLAKLSRLKLTDDEVETFQKEITTILNYAEQLQEVDTDGITPTYQVIGLTNVTRADEVRDYGITKEALLKNAPDTEKSYLKVKRMIG